MPTTERSEAGRAGRILLTLSLVVLVVAGVGLLVNRGVGPLPNPEGCHATVGGVRVDVTTEQAQNAALIAAVGVRRGLPARAVSIALATAFQESKLRNLDHGDRDSVGLFQQRPSMGWGTARQIADPYYATRRFYDALQKVAGYEQMRITVAAQRVQHSGFPEAYAAHETSARILASALTGYSTAAFSCVVHAPRFSGPVAEHAGVDGLTPRAEAVRRDVELAFGPQSVAGVAPGGRAFDLVVRPVEAANLRRGWAMAQYLVAQAKRLAIDRVVFDGRIWSAGSSSEQGWRRYAAGRRADRVHVDVVKGG